MQQKINPCLWFDHQAAAAVKFYRGIFKNSQTGRSARYSECNAAVSGQKAGSLMTQSFDLEDLHFLALNGGPHFKFSGAFSFFVSCESSQDIEQKWQQLSAGGTARMPLDKYPWAEKYAWVADKFGVDWQLMLAPRKTKISPAFLFVNELLGKGEEAVTFYTSLFAHSKIESKAFDEKQKTLLHCSFSLAGQGFVLMEGEGQHDLKFTPATSLIVNCQNQDEIDHFWTKLSAGGQPSQCGWLSDRYGVSWQIVPAELGQWVSNPAHAEKLMPALLKMKKIDIATLKKTL